MAALANLLDQMLHAVVEVEPPHLSARVFDVLEIGDGGIVIPHFAAPPRSHVEDMVEGRVDNAAVADHEKSLPAVACAVASSMKMPTRVRKCM